MLKLGELSTVLKADLEPFRRDLRRAKQAFQEHGQELKAGAAVAGAAIAAALGSGIASALQLDAAKTKLAAQLGGDPTYAADMGRIAGAVYARGFGESAEAVGETLRGVLTSGLVDEDATSAEIEALTIKAQALADTFGVDVTQTARAAGQMIRTGLADSAAEAFDILVRGFQQSGDHAGDTLDTVSEYSTQFRKLGLDAAEAFGLLLQGLKAGARDSDTVADALKEFAILAIDGSEATSEAFKALGLDATTMAAQIAAGGEGAQVGLQTVLDKLRAIEDPVTRDAIAVGLFGTKAEDLGAALFALDPESAAKGLGEVTGAADQLGQTLEESASQRLEAFKRQAQAALVEKLAAAVPYIEATARWLSEHSAIVGPLAVGLGILAAAIGIITLATNIYTAAQAALNTVMLLSPTTWIILAIVALIAIIVLIATKTTWFQDAWAWAWGGIKAAALAVGRWFRDTLWRDWILGAWNGIISAGERVWGWMSSLPGKIKNAFARIADILSSPFRWAFNRIAGSWNATIGRLSWTVPSWVPGLGGNTISVPQLPMLAKGGHILASGAAIVGEAGPELVHLDKGATVQPLTGGGHGEARELRLRLIHETPEGRVLREQLIDYAGQIGVAPSALLPSTR
ncbi:F0F1-type ATP synthase membrane subunit c/vacuolar-type H+-ATPase subunit K [Catenuloplanes nepalensis]|uniref:F0F1-type ATP synthase membrane subunit c/vacuolar-type H+-ATPase subunit K n=1 Tax=Catenuloplanes nepalensis TaxID=587533 RepID=A0ABT9N6L3_9ACTN|nr:phage tail tape measure protein [Catenuloplanes nepalensis]MDP9799343.1 F0F1-type ATP synthase membrane subunit c/vacuolar-type H+-ATPase subunit K [Catenuloplanes nepalensis]